MSFFDTEPLTLMISSRCNDKVEYLGELQRMSKVRKAMKAELEALELAGQQLFKVWIHEDESKTTGDKNTWDTCIDKSRKADIFLALYNGNAGWAGESKQLGDHVGICHAELHEAFNKTPSKVYTIQFPAINTKAGTPNERFQRYFTNQKLPGPQVESGEEAIEQAREVAISAMMRLARAGIGAGSKGSYFAGEALAWTRLDYHGRREVTTKTMVGYLVERSTGKELSDLENTVTYPLAGQSVAFVCDCIPASMSTAAARELVGQPFLHDHEICQKLSKDAVGPVHLIACQKNVSESQALKQLGFPDAVVVTAPFGIYVADDIQKIQMVFIANCRDETTTRHHLQRFLQWLTEQGEDQLLVKRAQSRRRIGNLISKEQ